MVNEEKRDRASARMRGGGERERERKEKGRLHSSEVVCGSVFIVGWFCGNGRILSSRRGQADSPSSSSAAV